WHFDHYLVCRARLEDDGWPSKVEFLGENSKPVNCKRGFARLDLAADGERTVVSLYDESGQPVRIGNEFPMLSLSSLQPDEMVRWTDFSSARASDDGIAASTDPSGLIKNLRRARLQTPIQLPVPVNATNPGPTLPTEPRAPQVPSVTGAATIRRS